MCVTPQKTKPLFNQTEFVCVLIHLNQTDATVEIYLQTKHGKGEPFEPCFTSLILAGRNKAHKVSWHVSRDRFMQEPIASLSANEHASNYAGAKGNSKSNWRPHLGVSLKYAGFENSCGMIAR